MRITCPSCSAEYDVDDARIPAGGLNVRCPRCQEAFPVRHPGPQAAGAVPLPPAPAPAEPGGTIAFASPFASPPPEPPPEPPPAPDATRGATMTFDSPFAASAPAAAGPAKTPEPAESGTLHFSSPFAAEKTAQVTPPFGSVALPAPRGEAAAPAAAPPPLAFGEVELAGDAAASAFDAEPLPAAPEVPPPADPFAAGPANPPAAPKPDDPFPPAAEPPPSAAPAPAEAAAPDSGPSAQELEALFEEGGVSGRTARRPAPTGPGWRVRRRSGKVFGPFQEADVVDMLGRGELLGNEEVTGDERNWTAIGEVPAFGEAIRRLIDLPVAGDGEGARRGGQVVPFGTRVAVGEAEAGPAAPSLLARLPAWTRIAAPAAAAAVVLAVGLGAGFTDNGVFFQRLLRGQVGPKRPGARFLAQARERLAEDAWPGAQAALDLADQAIRLSPVDREAKGVYAQVAYWMARRTGAPREAVGRARAFVAEIAQREPRAADTLKARVSAALADGALPAGADVELERWLARAPGDEEAAVLLGELAIQRGDPARAEGFFQRLEQRRPGSARGAHALGLAAAARGDGKVAAQRFEEALRREPGHLASAVELAEMAARAGDLGLAARRLDLALAPEAKDLLGPRERARARVLRGQVMARDLGDQPEVRLAAAGKELEAAVQEDPTLLPARIAWARFLLRRGAPEGALAALEPAAAQGGAEVVDLQARALAASGRVFDATNVLEAALARMPGDPRLVFARGLVLAAGGKRAEAERLYAEAAKDPASWEAHLALGRSRLRAGEVEQAAPEVLLAAERAPREAEAQCGLGELRLAKRDLGGAEEAFRKALSLDPSHAASHGGLARVAVERGNPDAAIASLERAVRFDARSVEARTLLGSLKWRRGDLAGAEVELRAAAVADPKNALVRTRLGAVQLEMGRAEPALEHLLAASNLEVALAENRHWLGRALLAKGDAVPAVEQLKKAVELEPGNALSHLWLGAAYDRASNPGDAVDSYRAALARDPKLVDAAERLGLLYAGLNRCPDAVPWFDKAIQLAPREQRLRMELADCRARMGQHAQAIQLYKDALRADPKLVSCYYRIARAVHDSAGVKEALSWYERAAKEDGSNPMPHYYLGFAWKERGKRSRAVESFRAYLRLRPDAEDKKDIEREIEDLGG